MELTFCVMRECLYLGAVYDNAVRFNMYSKPTWNHVVYVICGAV